MSAESTRDRILEAALVLAEQRSWERLRLHDVAAELKLGLNDVRVHFREKEDLIDAWFDRADAAMLDEVVKPELLALSPRDRLHRLMMVWFTALTPHRSVTRQMIGGKLEPGHVHYQYAGLLRVSRTVQWWREAARREAALPWRALEEAGLTAIYLAAFFYWMRDDSEHARRTSLFLDSLLARAERLTRWFPGYVRPSAASGVATREQ